MLNKKLFRTVKIAIMGLLIVASASVAAKQGHIKFSSHAYKVISVKNAQGQMTQKLIPAKKVLPGEIVQYTNTFENISKESANHIGVTNPIPQHTVYIPNSANNKNFDIVYSVDGGKHWGKPSTLKVKGKDGKMRPAKASDYTHIRWKYKSSLKPGEKKSVSYQVRLL